MHIFLHYLIYDHPEQLESKEKVFENLEGYFTGEFLDMDVYSKDVNWKMFIPPLPHHRGKSIR